MITNLLKYVVVIISIISVSIVSVQAARTKTQPTKKVHFKLLSTDSIKKKTSSKKKALQKSKGIRQRHSTKSCQKLIATGESDAVASFRNAVESSCLDWDDVQTDVIPSGFASAWVWYVTTEVFTALKHNSNRWSPKTTLDDILNATKDPALSVVAKATYRSVFYNKNVLMNDYDRHLTAAWLDYMMLSYCRDLDWKRWLSDPDSSRSSLVWRNYNRLYDNDLGEETGEMVALAKSHKIKHREMFCNRQPAFFRSRALWMLVITAERTDGKALLPAVGGITNASEDAVFSAAVQEILYQCILAQKDCLKQRERILLEFWIDYYCSMIPWSEWRSSISGLVVDGYPVCPESCTMCQNEIDNNPSESRAESGLSDQGSIPDTTTIGSGTSSDVSGQSAYSLVRLSFQVISSRPEAKVLLSPGSTLRQKRAAVISILTQDMLDDELEMQSGNRSKLEMLH